MNNQIHTSLGLLESHNQHILVQLLPFVVDVLEELECTNCKFESTALPDPHQYLDQKEFAREINENWHCTFYVNGYFAFQYRLIHNIDNNEESRFIHKIAAQDDQLYFRMSGPFQEVNDWTEAKDAIRCRLRRLIQITIPLIEQTAETVKSTLGDFSIRYDNHDHDGITYRCTEGRHTFYLKVNHFGEVLRRDDTYLVGSKYFKVGEISGHHVFTPERMKQLMLQDAFLQVTYNDLIRKYKSIPHAEYRALELLFATYVLTDTAMERLYSEQR
ncbi:hypothetical protein PV433_10745 [Paenibacillus sp. GYB004]|uniref:hypothetical protein n=1 Tax=Paenibacillus sp. GYB004 TaxID=2994393 RepID=UPI002F961940